MEVKVIFNDGMEHIAPYANLDNIKRIWKDKIKKIINLSDGKSNTPTPFKVNRESLETIAKRDLKLHWKTIASLSDDELLLRVKQGN